MNCFVSCVSRDHVVAGVEGEYVQSKDAAPLKRLEPGDLVLFYSEGTKFRAGERLQAFTAVGRVADRATSQVTVTPVFKPWRRRSPTSHDLQSRAAATSQFLPLLRRHRTD